VCGLCRFAVCQCFCVVLSYRGCDITAHCKKREKILLSFALAVQSCSSLVCGEINRQPGGITPCASRHGYVLYCLVLGLRHHAAVPRMMFPAWLMFSCAVLGCHCREVHGRQHICKPHNGDMIADKHVHIFG
jgi:hypothetical protein